MSESPNQEQEVVEEWRRRLRPRHSVNYASQYDLEDDSDFVQQPQHPLEEEMEQEGEVNHDFDICGVRQRRYDNLGFCWYEVDLGPDYFDPARFKWKLQGDVTALEHVQGMVDRIALGITDYSIAEADARWHQAQAAMDNQQVAVAPVLHLGREVTTIRLPSSPPPSPVRRFPVPTFVSVAPAAVLPPPVAPVLILRRDLPRQIMQQNEVEFAQDLSLALPSSLASAPLVTLTATVPSPKALLASSPVSMEISVAPLQLAEPVAGPSRPRIADIGLPMSPSPLEPSTDLAGAVHSPDPQPDSDSECDEILGDYVDWEVTVKMPRGPPPPRQKKTCPECKKVFARASVLKIHFNSVHAPNPIQYECPCCKIKFNRKDTLKCHLKSWCKKATAPT